MLFANGKEKNCFCKFYPHLLLFYEEESVAKQKLLAPVRLALSAQGLIMPINLNLLPDTLLSWSVETKHYSNCVACHLHHALVNFVLKGQVLARHSGMCLKSPLLRRLRQEDLKFKTSPGNLVRPFLKLEHKKGWGCSSMGEHIPSMPWVPSSAPTKRRRRRRRKKRFVFHYFRFCDVTGKIKTVTQVLPSSLEKVKI